jgi:protein TonB
MGRDSAVMVASDRTRARAAVAAAVVQGLLGYALISGLAVSFPRVAENALQTFALALPLPPPDHAAPPVARARTTSGKAAPPAPHAASTDIVAPRNPAQTPPVVVAPVAGLGLALAAGAAQSGAGSGATGAGAGTGSGDGGAGQGDGASDAELIKGRITDRDYPPDALAAGTEGLVGLRFTVAPDGRVSDCRVTRSIGDPALDALTCRLIVKRFRYRPALDGNGHPVAQVITGDHRWTIARSSEDDRDDQ